MLEAQPKPRVRRPYVEDAPRPTVHRIGGRLVADLVYRHHRDLLGAQFNPTGTSVEPPAVDANLSGRNRDHGHASILVRPSVLFGSQYRTDVLLSRDCAYDKIGAPV